jgi:hypothetical protein
MSRGLVTENKIIKLVDPHAQQKTADQRGRVNEFIMAERQALLPRTGVQALGKM